MTGRRVRTQAVVLAVVMLVSMVAAGVALAGTTVAQSNGPDNAGGGGSDNGGNSGGSSGGSDNGGGSGSSDSGGSGGSNDGGSGGSDNAGSGDKGGGSGNSDNAESGTEGAGGMNGTPGANASGAGDMNETPGTNASGGPDAPGADDAGPPANGQGPEAADGAGPEMAAVAEEVSRATPDAAATVDIEDRQPERPGLTVDPGSGTETVSAVTLEDEDLRGTIDIEEYGEPPEAVTESVAETVIRDIAAEPAENESAVVDPANETDDVANESAATGRVNVVTVANISVFDEDGTKASDANATIRMDLDPDDVENPDDAVVVHETDDGWEELNTSVKAVTNETVTVAAETGGFSIFAVAEVGADDSEASTTDDGEVSTNVSELSNDETPGFGVWTALLALAGVAQLSRRRR